MTGRSVSQLFLTILASVFLLGESADWLTWFAAILVAVAVAIGKTARVANMNASVLLQPTGRK